MQSRLSIGICGLLVAIPLSLQADERVLEEIVVTAQKREQSQQDVPISIQVLSGEDLSRNNINNVIELQNISPSITVADGWNPNVVSTTIRGIGTLLASENGEVQQSVVINVDDVPYSRAGGFWLDLMDIERVEVLRGPQGTLFGKNATGGVLNIVTAAPSTELAGDLELVATSDDEKTVRGTFTAPLGGVASRFTFWYSDRDGFIKNYGPAEDAGGRESVGARAKFEWGLSDNATALLTARYSSSDNSSQFVMAENFDAPLPGLMQADTLFPVVVGDENDKINTNGSSTSETDDWALTFRVNWDISDSMDLTSITAYRDIDVTLRTDVDQNALPFELASTNSYFLVYDDNFSQPQESSSLSQEFRLHGNNGKADWTVGAYFSRFEEDVNDTSNYIAGRPGVANSGFQIYNGLINDYENDSYAVFADVEWMLSDRLSLITGARWTREEIDYLIRQVSNTAPTTILTNDFSDTGATGRVSLKWRQSADTNFYATISQGYKGPGLSFTRTVSTTDEVEVDSEDALSYEAGVKSTLADGRLRFNANVFHTTVEDLQAFRLFPGTTSTELLNVGEAKSWGAEVEMDWIASDNLLLSLSLVYNDSEYTDFVYDCYAGQTATQGCVIDLSGDGVADAQDLEGEPLASLPRLKYVLSGRYDIKSDSLPVDLYISGKYRWQDDTHYLIHAHPKSIQDSFGILDLSLGVDDPEGKWEARLFVQNVTDEFYARRRSYAGAIGGAFHTLARDYETYYGINLRFRMGGQ